MCRKKQSSVGKIYKTTDGYLSGDLKVRKPRNVVAVSQRKDDGAISVAKISSKEGKEAKIGKTFIPGLVLKPAEHPALTEDSVIKREVIVGVKRGNGKAPIYPRNLVDTKDKLSRAEQKKLRKEVGNDTPQHRKTYMNTQKKWKKHFKK